MIEPDDEPRLREAYELECRSRLHGREGSPHWSWQEMAGTYRFPDSGERTDLLGGYVDDRLVGIAVRYFPLLDNTEKAWVEVDVDPTERRRGHGSQLLAAAEQGVRQLGRSLLVTELKIPAGAGAEHGYRRFAEQHGFTWANSEVVRWLDLPVPAAHLDAWSALAAERHEGFTLETHVDAVPDDLVPSLCVLYGQLAVDAPTGLLELEEEVITPERYAEGRVSLREQGRTILETVALTPDRTVVAQSTLAVPPPGRTDVSQWGTFVHREHRGHRLGLATKAANLRHLQQHHPEMTRVVTQNAETNDYMVSINELMGFAPVEVSVEMLRPVRDVAPLA